MTVTAIAKKLGVSPMTVYRRLKLAGVNIDTLRDATTHELTPAGASQIAALFDNTGISDSATTEKDDMHHVTTDGETGDITSDVVTVAVLRAQLDAAKDTISRLEAERERILNQLAAVTSALEREQADRQNERLMLAGSADGEPAARRHWWQWWRR